MRKSTLTLIFLLFAFMIGCAGREPNPVPIVLAGDENRSCESLKIEMNQIQEDMARLKPKTNKFVTNTFWFLFFTPLMDVKDAEKIEYDAFQQRYNHLKILSIEKDCGFVQTE